MRETSGFCSNKLFPGLIWFPPFSGKLDFCSLFKNFCQEMFFFIVALRGLISAAILILAVSKFSYDEVVLVAQRVEVNLLLTLMVHMLLSKVIANLVFVCSKAQTNQSDSNVWVKRSAIPDTFCWCPLFVDEHLLELCFCSIW